VQPDTRYARSGVVNIAYQVLGDQLLGTPFRDLSFVRGDCPQFGASAEDVWELFSKRYGPTVRAVSSLQGAALEAFRSELLSYLGGYRAADGKVRWGREYLITRAVRA
jgi:hypothetical protein